MSTTTLMHYLIPLVVGLVAGLLKKYKAKLPADLRPWVDRIGEDKLIQFAGEAEKLYNATGEERKNYVIQQILAYLPAKWQPLVSPSTLNWLAETALQLLKRSK